MSGLTFDNIASLGLLSEDEVDVLGAHLADALDLFVEKFGTDKMVKVSFVLFPVEEVENPSGGEDSATSAEAETAVDPDHGVAQLHCDKDDKAFAVSIDICTLPLTELSDQNYDSEGGDSENVSPEN